MNNFDKIALGIIRFAKVVSTLTPDSQEMQYYPRRVFPRTRESPQGSVAAIMSLIRVGFGIYFFFSRNNPEVTEELKKVLPAPNIDVEHYSDVFRGKKQPALAEIANFLTEHLKIAIVEGDLILAYDGRCHIPIRKPEVLLSKYLPPELYNRLSVKDVTDIIKRVNWENRCRCSIRDFNSEGNKICLANGIFDYVSETMTPHSEIDRFTYYVNAKYLSGPVSTPYFDAFCQSSLRPYFSNGEIEDQKVITQKRKVLLQFLGYILCDRNDAKVALFLQGEGDSGKSMFLQFITRLLPPETISAISLHELNDKFERAELLGKKVNIAGETKGKPLRDISIFKSITGSDVIEAQFKSEPLFHFAPTCKLCFAGNSFPTTSEVDTTDAYARRIVVLRFNHSIPKEAQDKNLLEKLWNERDGIVTLAMRELKGLHDNEYHFEQPEESLAFLNDFRSRNNSHRLFLDECCERGPDYRVHNYKLYPAYEKFCRDNGFSPCSSHQFPQLMSGTPGLVTKKFRLDGENRHGVIGIRLKPEYEENQK